MSCGKCRKQNNTNNRKKIVNDLEKKIIEFFLKAV